MKYAPSGQTIVLDPTGEQVLLVLRRDSGWGFPGGRCGDGETMEQAAIRSTFEQTGLTVEVDRVAAIGEFLASLSDVHHLFVVFAAREVAERVEPVRPADVADVKWVEPAQADWLVPWYPAGVRGLLENTQAVYYAHEGYE